MQRESVSCPRCETSMEIPPLDFPLRDPNSAEATGTILKRCPRCRTWNWMSLQTQGAA